MLNVITKFNSHLYQSELDQMFELRHRVLIQDLAWEQLGGENGHEQDQFDTEQAIYVVAKQDDNQRVVACARLHHSLLPNLSSEVFAPLFGPAGVLAGMNVYDGTRLVVDKESADPRLYRNRIIVGVGQIGEKLGATDLTGVAYYDQFQRYLLGGTPVRPLGLPESDGQRRLIAFARDLRPAANQKLQEALSYFPDTLFDDEDADCLVQTKRYLLSLIPQNATAA